jgi:hypothetical protein
MSTAPRRRLEVRGTGPGPGAGFDRDPARSAIVMVRIAIVATIVVGQLWALTVCLNAYFLGQMHTVWWLVGLEMVSFTLALVVWRMAPADR